MLSIKENELSAIPPLEISESRILIPSTTNFPYWDFVLGKRTKDAYHIVFIQTSIQSLEKHDENHRFLKSFGLSNSEIGLGKIEKKARANIVGKIVNRLTNGTQLSKPTKVNGVWFFPENAQNPKEERVMVNYVYVTPLTKSEVLEEKGQFLSLYYLTQENLDKIVDLTGLK
jgi:hypothetical protein